MKYTSNYNLKKPDLSDRFSIEDFNSNTQAIDDTLGVCTTKTALSDCVKAAIECLYPHSYSPTKIEATVGEDFYTNSGDSWFIYDISDDVFDPETDGLFVWRNDPELIAKSLYSLSRVLKPDENVTTWATYKTKLDLQDGDKVEFLIYKNSAATVTAGESIGLKAGATTAVSGVATPVEDDEEDNDD